MLQSTGHLKGIKFKKKEFRRDLETEIRRVMLTGMAKWLRAVITAVDGPGFPVQSGMAKASLKRIAEYLNAKSSEGDGRGVAFDINPDYSKVIPGKKSIGQGVAESKKDNFLMEYRNQYGTFYYKFDWWTNVEHYIQNDAEVAPEALHLIWPTPWNTIPAGESALDGYIKNRLDKLPKIQDYIFPGEDR